ncbi:unnamed protein product [Caenorhabditis auriculariae]|uniref:GP-PDE domain-containing protein n=1 Tax=Caenorhabditis auriculariae TaxID=2777116 RepID=A0A8S1GVP4_9PELO|nr:unnamed protein product [Caenorhabditis auriculariae]
MTEDVTIHFRVQFDDIREWEHMHVVGDHPALGDWMPQKSFALKPESEDRKIWGGYLKVAKSMSHISFRYISVYFLDPAETSESSSPVLILSRWETFLASRHCILDVEHTNGHARKEKIDIFGEYGGKVQISDGWILNDNEHVVFFRIHGEALKLFSPLDRKKTLRVKVVPFDVRFRDMFTYSKNSSERRAIWRHSSVYASVSKDVDENDPGRTPELPSFSNTDLSVLTREDPIYGDQYSNGSVFRNNVDYLVFRTRTVALSAFALRIELYEDKKRYALAYTLPTTFPETHGTSTVILVGLNQAPVGQMDLDYMIAKRCPKAKSFTAIDTMQKSFGRYWRRRNRILEIGHRGMGSSYTKETSARENTIFSLNEAARRGADYVELDVQITKDLKTVVYHDFHVLVHVAGRESPSGSPTISKELNMAFHQIAIKDLTLEQLNMLHLEHISRAACEEIENAGLPVTPAKDETNELHVPFPSIGQVLRNVHPDVGLNIEIKYPMFMKDGSHECEGYFEQNKFVDIILNEVAEFAGERRIVFSCFDPDICTLINQKQHKYPVVFLVVGATMRYTPFKDVRSDCSRIAANFAAGSQLLGVNFHSEELLNDRTPINIADRYKLVKFVWGDDLNDKKIQKYFKEEMNVDGIIFDRIGEEESKQNIFIVENRNKNSLFVAKHGRSPSPSRRCFSLDQGQ